LYIEYKDTIVTVFRNIGISLNPNRLENKELKIKVLDRITIGDWHRFDILQTKEQDTVTAQIVLEVEEACQNSTIQVKIEAEKDKEDTLELDITRASLQASNVQRRNRYFLAEEDKGSSKVTEGSKSEGSEFDSSDNEEARDYIIL
jgi:YbbR domain-containing protein